MATKKPTKTIPTSRVILKQDVRSANAIEKRRTEERARLRNYETIERVAENQQILAAKTREYRARRSEQANYEAAGAGRSAATSAASNISPTGSPFFLFIFVVFGLIIFYTLVTQPQPTNRFFASLSDWLSLISTSTPIFQKKAT